MTKTPKVSVVMPVYNAEQYLEEAVSSLLIQTYEDFEIIAINDGSTDGSQKILESIASRDPRLKIIQQANHGIVQVLNRGIKEANGDYIARMDADDVSFPCRLEQQVAILDAKPEVILVCGNFEIIDEDSEFLYRELLPPSDEDIKRALFLRNPIAHGSTMMRKTALQEVGGYSDEVGPTEDLDLWMRLSLVGEFASTATTIYKWRMNRNGITLSNNTEAMQWSKTHIERRWAALRPEYLSRSRVMERSSSYYRTYEKYGTHYKYIFLTDTSQMAVKLLRHGRKLDGFKQLLVILSTGRTGLKVVLKRLRLVGQGHVNKLRKNAKFGRDSLSD